MTRGDHNVTANVTAPKNQLLAASKGMETARCAAADLIELASTGRLSTDAIRALGTNVVGYDLDSPVWLLPGWKKPRWLGHGTGIVAMDRALAEAFKPQRVRLGERWVKDDTGRVDEECIPATDLRGERLPRALRALCLREVRAEADFMSGGLSTAGEDPGAIHLEQASEQHLFSRAEVALCLVGEFSKRPAIHPYALEPLRGPARLPVEMEPQPRTPKEFFEELSFRLDATEREVLRLKIADESEIRIATRLGCSDRTVRRIWLRVKEKAREFKPGTCPPLVAVPPTAANEPLAADPRVAA
jgi:DNA-binding CsgD family transcriptional regulator